MSVWTLCKDSGATVQPGGSLVAFRYRGLFSWLTATLYESTNRNRRGAHHQRGHVHDRQAALSVCVCLLAWLFVCLVVCLFRT